MGSEIKNKIKSIRELRNYTQLYMAEKLNITQAAYSKIEKGRSKLSYCSLEKIAFILEVNVETIIQFEFNTNFVGQRTENRIISDESHFKNDVVLVNLYEDKIYLLERLLNSTESELKKYKDRYGLLNSDIRE